MTEARTSDVFSEPEVLRECLRRAGELGVSVVEALREEGWEDELIVLRSFATKLGIAVAPSLEGRKVAERFIAEVPVAFARHHGVVGLEDGEGSLAVATSSPLDFRPLDDIGKALGVRVEPVLAPRDEITRCLHAAYGEAMRAESAVSEDLGSLESLIEESAELAVKEELLDLAQKPPLVRLVNRIFLQALELRASDIHFHPMPDCLQVRFRVDGVLHDTTVLPKEIQGAVISRIKVMGRMDIAEKRLAQDGRSTVRIGTNDVDLRIASLPTSCGEQVVIRLLDKGSRLLTRDELGMETEVSAAFGELIHSSHGIVLVTGPTGSGKTTTLYAALQELNSREKHIVTLEDPIEYQLEGISQTQVNYKKGLTFAGGLRNVLRQDPDIIMVGEIRDLETARMAIQSALTGHLVLSTLHTNDSVSATTRLLDLGIEPYLVCSSVIGILAQRLVRRICPDCKEEAPASPELMKGAGIAEPPESLWAGRGCEECLHTGYWDRVGIFEFLPVGDALRAWIMERRQGSAMKADLVASGLRTLRMDGVEKALRGVTTLEEVMRVTQRDEH